LPLVSSNELSTKFAVQTLPTAVDELRNYSVESNLVQNLLAKSDHFIAVQKYFL